MEDLIGVYGILDRDHWPEAPFQLLDGGVEIRWKEPYAFHNAERGTYSGCFVRRNKGRKQNKWNEKHSNRALAFFWFRQDVPSASEMYGNFRIW